MAGAQESGERRIYSRFIATRELNQMQRSLAIGAAVQDVIV